MTAARGAAPDGRRLPWLLLLVVAMVFAPALWGQYVYDDRALVLRNPALLHDDLAALVARPFWGQDLGYWRPLPLLLLWLGDRLGGAAGVHTIALLAHLAATWLAFDIALRFMGERRFALFAAVVFALHPVQVESVAWCSAISDVTWGAAALAAMRGVLLWRQREHGAPWRPAAWCFVALCCKETAIVLPLLMVAALELGGTLRPRWRAFAATLSVALAAWWALRALVFGDFAGGALRHGDAAPIGWPRAMSAPAELLLRHLRLLLPPVPSTPFLPFATSLGPGLAFWWLVMAVVAVGLMALVWRRGGTAVRLAVLLVLLPLLPTALLFHAVGSHPIADRYLYLPAFGAALLAAFVLRRMQGIWLWLVPAVFGALSFAQTLNWHDPRSLVATGLWWNAADPTLLVMEADRQLELAQAGDAAALAAAQQSYAEGEREAAQQSTGGTTHRALGAARLGLAWCRFLSLRTHPGPVTAAEYDALIAAFQRAVDADDRNAEAWVGLGVANGAAGRGDAAERAFRRAIELDPENGKAWFNLGFLQANQRRVGDARTSLQRALYLDPGNRQAEDLIDRLR